MDISQIISTTAIAVLTIIAAVIGIQVILILKEVKRSIDKVNSLINTAQDSMDKFSKPLIGLAGVFEGLKQSTKVIELVSDFMNRNKKTQAPVDIDDDYAG